MGSKKEEERNEKIIRGLMKLPPNRRCINCNSLGPQYVCTNFWSFVCTTCSGIHREFTHRVKSVSMAKFTSQEVDALQNGGNQRAREMYLKNWDLQRQRLPDSSNVDKIRQFIKDVYVDKTYVVGQTSEKPPRDTQNRGIREDDTRRASSYHSFSQSPPYDYQYEDRRYGKQAGSLTRKPGSDHGCYEGKMSSFVYSPGRVCERMYDEGISSGGSVSRVSDYSVSSAGDPFKSGAQSPNFQQNMGLGSPPFPISRDASSEDVRHRSKDSFPQRSRSAGSFGSIDSNFASHTSFNLVGFTDAVSESEQAAEIQDQLPCSRTSDFFKAPAVLENAASAAPIDLFQLPEAPASLSVDLFQAPLASAASSKNAFQPVQAYTTGDLFVVSGQPQSSATSNENLPVFSVSENDGWATFDMPQSSAPTLSHESISPTIVPSDIRLSLGGLDLFSSLDSCMQWPASQNSSFHSNLPPSCNDCLHSVTASDPTNTQVWNAFEDSLEQQPLEGINQDSGVLGFDMVSSTANQHSGVGTLESSVVEHFDWTVSHGVPPPVPFSVVSGPSYIPPALPPMGETEKMSSERKSNNPFDLPCDSQLEENDMFMDMTSLHTALPSDHLSSSFVGDVSQPWFPQNSTSHYIPAAGQGGTKYLIPQAPSPQISNVSTQGSLASIGGNPFA